jgi:Transposase DNA-binding/Transposase Tn5 dimerisation domain
MQTGWAAIELQDLDLGDARRTRRAIQLVETLALAPQASVPNACGTWAATKAAYRFWSTPEVTPAAMRAAHTASAVRRMANLDTVLVVQDTTELDFTTQPAMTGRGKLAHPAHRGLFVHSGLALSPDGTPLGIVHQQSWIRDPDAPPTRQDRRKKATAEKESQRWLSGLTLGELAIPERLAVVMIADREADIFDLFAQERRAGSDWLIRATHDRRVAVDDPAQEATGLVTALARTEVAGHSTVVIPRGRGRPEREATLTLRFREVAIRPPGKRPKHAGLTPVTAWAVLAEELDPPDGLTPIRWMLLTSRAVTTLAQALQCVAWYRLRWLIERYHYVLKEGCRVEALQLGSIERLERALATYCIVSWRILWLSIQARQTPQASCELILAEHEWQALACGAQRTAIPPTEPPTLLQAVRWIAQLGGFLGRRGDGEPGVKVLWRGMHKLEGMVQMWVLLKGIDLHASDSGGLMGNG